MHKKALLSHLRELRDVKFRLASRAFKRYYDSWRHGHDEESRVIRFGALGELRELLTLEEWISSLTGGVECTVPLSPSCKRGGVPEEHAATNEVRERCRIMRLINQQLGVWRGNGVTAALRTFLVQLVAEEAGRVNALLTTDRVVG